MDRILTLAEVAEWTRVPASSLRYRRLTGKDAPKLFRLGKRLVAKESDVQAWIDEQAAKGGDEAA